MDILIKAAAIGIVSAVLGLVIKKSSPEMALLLAAGAAALIFGLMLTAAESVKEFVESVAETVNLTPAAVTAVMKTIGIGIVSRLASDVCKDAGQSAAASGIELAGSVAALCAAIPLMQAVINTIKSFL